MNIGIVTTWFERGAAYVSRQYMEVLQKTDNVYIYARGGEKYAIGNPHWDLPNVHWGIRNDFQTKYVANKWIDKKDFLNWIERNSIEVVLFNEQDNFEPVIWCKEKHVKTIAYIDYYNELTIPLFDVYDALICNTKRHAFAFRKHVNTKYICWGTDVNLYHPSNEEHDRLTFFHSAGMAPFRKGTDLLIQSFYNMRNRKSSKLLIHTQVSLDDIFPEISQLVTELKKEGTLEIVEKTITAPGLYYKGDVYVYPSRLDGVGLTLMEAAASGLSVITTDNPPMNEFINDSFGKAIKVEYQYSRIDGYYWPMAVASTSSLTEQMDWYVENSSKLELMKNNARNFAVNNLDFEKNFSELYQIIRDIKLQPLTDDVRNRAMAYDNRGLIKYMKKLEPLYPIIKKIMK